MVSMDPVLLELDYFLQHNSAVEKLSPVIMRLLQELEKSPAQPQAWQPLEDSFFDTKLPAGIVSAWLFALRGSGTFTNERHPNSWQRSIALSGHALFEVYEDGVWQARPLSGAGVNIGERAISIPPNIWHRIAIGPETFVSLSFHTAPASELIEETCVGDDFSRTNTRLYHG